MKSQRNEPAGRADIDSARKNAIAKHEEKAAIRNAVEWIDGLVAQHESVLRELKSRREDFIAAATAPNPRERGYCSLPDHIGFIINSIQNGMRNYRLDLAPGIGASLAVVEAAARALRRGDDPLTI